MEVKKRTISIDKEVKVLKLKIKVGTMIYDGSILLIYEELNKDKVGNGQKKLKSTEIGVVKRVPIKEGDIIQPGSIILELEKECNHPTVIKDLCAECGADLQKEKNKDGGPITQASVSMVHMVPELKVNDELAQILGKADMDRLLQHRKLVLLVDLDQTLIHTTNDIIPNNIKDVCHFQLYGARSPWYHTRLRPGTHNFLQGISEKYELHICTFGSRRYAHKIAEFLDPDGKFFSHRILSRDECFDSNSKTANLKALFPCGESMVCIIDDREDVWEYASNLIHVKPYHFFQHTGDIHAPPGLTKCENDSQDGFDFSHLNNGIPGETSDEKDSSAQSTDESIKEKEEEFNNGAGQNSSQKPGEDLKESIIGDSTDEKPVLKQEIMTVTPSVSDMDIKSDVLSESNENTAVKTELNSEKIKDEKIKNETDSNIEDEQPVNPSPVIKMEIDDVAEAELPPVLQTGSAAEIGVAVETGPSDTDPPFDVTDGEKQVSIAATAASSSNAQTSAEDSDVAEKPAACVSASRIDAEGQIVIEETDDYLLYLEEILKTIHAEFFKLYEQSGQIPDLKQVVPQTRAKVLNGVSLVFSGIVPNRMRLEESQPYRIARLLGANVTQNIESETTHLVAFCAGTAKVHAAYKRKNLKLVTPDWLWTCAERWEKVDERLFPLKNAKMNVEARHPPAHCRSPEHPEPTPFTYMSGGGGVGSADHASAASSDFSAPQVAGFMYTINPLMSLSSEDIETMEGEVADIFKESDGEADDPFGANDDEATDDGGAAAASRKRKLSVDSSSSEDNEQNRNKLRERRIKKLKNVHREKEENFVTNYVNDEDEDNDNNDNESISSNSDDETISAKFRRGEALPSDLDFDFNSEEGSEEDQESDGEWNVMGAALEREFLEGE